MLYILQPARSSTEELKEDYGGMNGVDASK